MLLQEQTEGYLAPPRPKPSYRMTRDEIYKVPHLIGLYRRQEKPESALEGELGIFRNPDGSFSTERSATRRTERGWVNFPLLVRGQSDAAIQRILSGKHLPEDEDVAYRRFLERIKSGLPAPTFHSEKEAVAAAIARSKGK